MSPEDIGSRLRQWALNAETAATSYVATVVLVFYLTKGQEATRKRPYRPPRYRFKAMTRIQPLGMFHGSRALRDLDHPFPVVGLHNGLEKNNSGYRPDVPTIVLEILRDVGWAAFRAKHLVSLKGHNGGKSPFNLIQETFPTLKGGIGYVPSLFSALQAGGYFENVKFVVDFVRDADGKPALSDGGSLYIDVPTNPIARYACGEELQGRMLDAKVTKTFGKGMWSPVGKDRVPERLLREGVHLIVDPSAFKAGGACRIPAGHPLLDMGFEGSYPSRKEFFKAAARLAPGIVTSTASFGVLRVKCPGSSVLTPQALVRLLLSAVPLAKELLSRNWDKWIQSGGVDRIFSAIVEKEKDDGIPHARNVKAMHSMMNAMLKELGDDDRVDPLSNGFVRNKVVDALGRKFYRFATGCGLTGHRYVVRLDGCVPKGVLIVPSTYVDKRGKVVKTGFRHGDEAVCWRQPIITTTGVFIYTLWVLDDELCPESIQERWGYLAGSNAVVAGELAIIHRFQGDNDGDDLAISNDPLLLEMYKKHLWHVFEPGERVLIEGYEVIEDCGSDEIDHDLMALAEDRRGPVGPQTNVHTAGFALKNEEVVLALQPCIQVSVDQAKARIKNPDHRVVGKREHWVRTPVPGYPGEFGWKPPQATLPPSLEDGKGYPDISKFYRWAKDTLGVKVSEAIPWNRSNKKLTPECVAAGPITERSVVDAVYNHFLKLLSESDIDIFDEDFETGRAMRAEDLIELIRWKTKGETSYDYLQGVSDWTGDYYKDLLKRSGLLAYGATKSQVLGLANLEARERNRLMAGAEERLLAALATLTIEERLTIWLTEHKELKSPRGDTVTNKNRAYLAVYLGDNPITRLLELEVFASCSFMVDNASDYLERVKANMACPHGTLNLHRFGTAGAAVLEGVEFKSGDEGIKPVDPAETLAALHELETGEELQKCSSCHKSAKSLLVNLFRAEPPPEMLKHLKDTVRELNKQLRDDNVQQAIGAALAEHYEEY